jgi:predicted dithiol-disulfide oxidoreductase (DUF899 family)/uncharacterized protein YndB with AHSA1/START domain
MKSDTEDFDHVGQYQVVDPPSKLVFTWISKGTQNQTSLVTIELAQQRDMCELMLTHEQLPNADAAKHHQGGWNQIADRLAAHLAPRSITHMVAIPAPPPEVFEALLDPAKHAQFTGAPAAIERRAGGSFSLYGGHLTGKLLEWSDSQRIVEEWRAQDWSAGHYSKVTFDLAPVDGGAHTQLSMTQTGIPANRFEDINRGWQTHYWKPMAEFFGKTDRRPETFVRVTAELPGESIQYRSARNRLLQAEIALKDQRERVAQLRRELPMGRLVETDYVFREGPADIHDESTASLRKVRLSELFAPGKDSLIVDHLMWAPGDKLPCRMCNMWADSYDAVAPHVSDKVNFVLVAKVEIGALRDWARRRGWDKIRLLSSHDNTFNRDFLVEEDHAQRPGVSVFRRQPGGKIYHFYTTEAAFGPAHHRGIDLFSPVWHLLDLLPEGRENWMPKHSY